MISLARWGGCTAVLLLSCTNGCVSARSIASQATAIAAPECLD
jgi:hypothetical protein